MYGIDSTYPISYYDNVRKQAERQNGSYIMLTELYSRSNRKYKCITDWIDAMKKC